MIDRKSQLICLFRSGFKYCNTQRIDRKSQLVTDRNIRPNAEVPEEGEVRFITITDKQFAKMKIFQGEKAFEPENVPAQLEFF